MPLKYSRRHKAFFENVIPVGVAQPCFLLQAIRVPAVVSLFQGVTSAQVILLPFDCLNQR